MLHTYTLSKPEKLVIKNIKNQLNNNKSIQELSIKEYGELSPESNLAEALSLHHGEVVDILIENDALTNSVLTNDSLIHALYANHHKVVEHIIHKPDFNPNYTNDYGCSILMAACSVGNFPVVQFLINSGARINEDKQSPLGEGKALVSACSSEFAKSSIDIVYFLVERGAKVNAYSQGTTPLICASYTKNIELVQFLLCQGADPRAIRETDGATAIMVAAREGSLDILKLLVNESDIHHLDNKSQNTLFYASQSNSPQVVEFLISLYQDAVIGHINAKNTYGLNCLLVACKRGNPDIVNLLINAGADVNSADNYHNNTLIEAVRGRSLDVVQALLASGLEDINHQNKGGYTGLMHAVNYCTSENMSKDIVNLLVKTGVDINIKNSENLSAWDLALQSKNQEVVALLEDNDTNQSFSCMISGETSHSDTDSI